MDVRAQPSQTVVIVGGAIVGTSIAYFLRELGFEGEILVVERDPTYARSSTALSAASIRTQFGCAINVRMSLFGAEFLRSIKDRFGKHADVGFTERGYLILGSPGSTSSRRAAAALQRTEGAVVSIFTPVEAQDHFPWLNVDDLGIATFGERHEGWFDAWSFLQLMRRAARERDVTYIVGEAQGVDIRAGRVTGVRLAGGETIAADWCINAAGAASASLVRDAGLSLPVEARKRTAFAFKAPLHVPDFPMLFDTSGAWIRPEGDGFIGGIAPKAEDDHDAFGDFEPHYDFLETILWPALAHRVPALEQLRVERSWAGHYEVNTLDHNGIIGEHDEVPNLIFATGFSGHGLMHAPATGRGVAELIVHGSYQTLDLSPLGYGRIRAHTPLRESVVY